MLQEQGVAGAEALRPRPVWPGLSGRGGEEEEVRPDRWPRLRPHRALRAVVRVRDSTLSKRGSCGQLVGWLVLQFSNPRERRAPLPESFAPAPDLVMLAFLGPGAAVGEKAPFK